MNREQQAAYAEQCIKIEPLALEEEFVRLPGDLAYWNAQYAAAYEAYLLAEVRRDRAKFQAAAAARAALKQRDPKATEAAIEADWRRDPTFQQADLDMAYADGEKERLRGVCESLRAKREMLVSLGAHIRAEMGMDPTIRREQRLDHTIREANQRHNQ
jgi:hypothetical protein